MGEFWGISLKNSSLLGLVSYNDPCKTLSFWGWRCPVISGEISCVVFGWWNHVHVFFLRRTTLSLDFFFGWFPGYGWHFNGKHETSFFFWIFISPENYQFCILKNGCFFQVRTLKLQHVQKVVATHTFFFEFFTTDNLGIFMIPNLTSNYRILFENGLVKNHQLVIQVPAVRFWGGCSFKKKCPWAMGAIHLQWGVWIQKTWR